MATSCWQMFALFQSKSGLKIAQRAEDKPVQELPPHYCILAWLRQLCSELKGKAKRQPLT